MMGLISAWYNHKFGYKGSIYVRVRMFCIKLLQYEQLQITMELKKTQVNVKNTVVDPYVHASIFGVLLRTNSKRGGQKLRKNWGQKLR